MLVLPVKATFDTQGKQVVNISEPVLFLITDMMRFRKERGSCCHLWVLFYGKSKDDDFRYHVLLDDSHAIKIAYAILREKIQKKIDKNVIRSYEFESCLQDELADAEKNRGELKWLKNEWEEIDKELNIFNF